MEQRKYSISEIDQMRSCLQHICRDNSVAEDQLRTYMLNGTETIEIAYACFEEIQRGIEQSSSKISKLRAYPRLNNSAGWSIS